MAKNGDISHILYYGFTEVKAQRWVTCRSSLVRCLGVPGSLPPP